MCKAQSVSLVSLRTVLLVVGLVASLTYGLAAGQHGSEESGMPATSSYVTLAYTSHEVISIDGDVDFDIRAEAEGWPGDGSEEDPYIIAGYDINGTDYRTAIAISNTRVHFIIAECWLHNGRDHGIDLRNVTNGTLESNLCTGNAHDGMRVSQSGNVNISDNSCSGNEYGIYVLESPGTELYNNTCTLNTFSGAYVSHSGYSVLRSNNCTGNSFGMAVSFSPSVSIDSNNFSENDGGGLGMTANSWCNVTFNRAVFNGGPGMYGTAYLMRGNLCSFNLGHGISAAAYKLLDNICHHNGLSGIRGEGFTEVRGNDCSYNSDGIVMDSAGFSMPRIDRYFTDNDCSGNSNSGIWISGAPWGSEQHYLTIANNTCSGTSGSGISLSFVHESVVANNTCTDNAEYGAVMKASGSIRLTGNDISFNGRYGLNFTYVELSNMNRYYSGGIYVDNCTFVDNVLGSAYLDKGSNFKFEDCTFAEGSKISVFSQDSTVMVLKRNVMTGCGVMIRSGTEVGWNSHAIEDTNLVNGKPVMYLVGGNAAVVPAGLGQMILVECRNMVVSGQLLNDVSVGLVLAYSMYNTVTDNNVCCCLTGIYLNHSDSNEFTRNAMYDNTGYGLHIDNGFDNLVYDNTFHCNNGAGSEWDPEHVQARDDGLMNSWNEPGHGNYWSDWTSPDSEPDGIVDVPYAIDGTAGAMDYFPLVGMPVPIPELSPAAVVLALMSAMAIVCAAGRASRRTGLG